jgi:hypothetical protein
MHVEKDILSSVISLQADPNILFDYSPGVILSTEALDKEDSEHLGDDDIVQNDIILTTASELPKPDKQKNFKKMPKDKAALQQGEFVKFVSNDYKVDFLVDQSIKTPSGKQLKPLDFKLFGQDDVSAMKLNLYFFYII